MWIDSVGVAHTVAIPDAASVVSDAFLDSYRVLIASGSRRVATLLEAEEEQYFDAAYAAVLAEDQEDFIALPIGDEHFGEPVANLDDLRAAILAIDPRWRLDALLVLQELRFEIIERPWTPAIDSIRAVYWRLRRRMSGEDKNLIVPECD